MIIKSFELSKLISLNLSLHLIYGINEGVKLDIINNFYLKNFKGDILKYDEQEILAIKDEFISSLLNRSLFENKKLVIISRATDKLYNLIIDILDRELLDTKIIIKCSNLEKKSKLRNLFEKEKLVICTPVYEDDTKSLNMMIQHYLKDHNFNLSQEIRNILVERSKGDRLNLRNELIKLKNLSISKKKLSTDDVSKLSNLVENFSVFELSDSYLAKNSKKVSNILNENNYTSEDCILIIRTLLNKSKRLLKIKNEMDGNRNIDQIISTFKPPIFWKEKDIVKRQAQSWSTNEVKDIIFKINNLEILVKKNAQNSILFVSNFVSNY
tara:strand:- start:735 stop:1712 length:978 start_codon:yes stop_codon:yes gene_type:complete